MEKHQEKQKGLRLHQGSSQSQYLFAMIMDVLAHRLKDLSLWCILIR